MLHHHSHKSSSWDAGLGNMAGLAIGHPQTYKKISTHVILSKLTPWDDGLVSFVSQKMFLLGEQTNRRTRKL